jgi:hypothetical protein
VHAGREAPAARVQSFAAYNAALGEGFPEKWSDFNATSTGLARSLVVPGAIVRRYEERYRTEPAHEEMKGELGLDALTQ